MREEEIKKIFSDNLNYYLKLNGRNQVDLYKYMKVSSATASNWCTGQKMPRADKIQTIARWLGVEIGDLMQTRNGVLEVAFPDSISFISNDATQELYKKIFSRKLREYLDQTQKNQMDLVNDLGLSPSTVSNWCTGVMLPRMGKIQMLADYFGIEKSDLLEDKKLNKSRSILSETTSIRIYDAVSVGVPFKSQDSIGEEIIPKEWTNCGQEYIALRLTGDSMYPKYLEGDIAIIRIQPDCESGQDCVVYLDDYDATLKTVIKNDDGTITLKPINPEWSPKTVTADRVKILGVVRRIRRDFDI